MSDVYTLEMTGNELKVLLDILKNSGVTEAQLGYLDGLIDNVQNQINSHTQAASRVTAGTFGGKVIGDATATSVLGDKQLRNITISVNEPINADGDNGDLWIVYSV